MSKKKANFSRRDFLKTAGALSLGTVLSPVESITYAKGESDPNESQQKLVPTRPFGKTGVNVPILGLGGFFSSGNLLVMKQAINMGVTYWDTAPSYGNSEKVIGKYFAKYPEDRKKVFLVTKSWKQFSTEQMEKGLDRSLKRMNTSYVDLYLAMAVPYIEEILPPFVDADPQPWVKKTKSEGKIRFFGFSTHQNVEENLIEAAKLGWIDGIMFSYNFRVMHNDKMKKAVDDCTKAGIGLTAMKTQASGHAMVLSKITPNETEQNLFKQLGKKGLTVEQAKLKTIWNDHRIASICSYMPNMKILMANASAAMDSTKLSSQDKFLLDQHAHETASNYCTGCASICESEINNEVPISDVMRYLMYSRCYGEPERAKSAFNGLPSRTRKHMANIDYSKAEKKCPQGMQIGRLMREAIIELA